MYSLPRSMRPTQVIGQFAKHRFGLRVIGPSGTGRVDPNPWIWDQGVVEVKDPAYQQPLQDKRFARTYSAKLPTEDLQAACQIAGITPEQAASPGYRWEILQPDSDHWLPVQVLTEEVRGGSFWSIDFEPI